MMDFKRRQIGGAAPSRRRFTSTRSHDPCGALKPDVRGQGEHGSRTQESNPEHPFNRRYEGPTCGVGPNFGWGRTEHAPQALMRWGISAIVGGSFGEIFFGNCTMLGIPCLTVSQADLEWLQKAIGRLPQTAITVDVEKQEVRFGDRVIKATVPDGARHQLVAGTWDSTAVLLEAGEGIEATAGKLPYVKGY